MKTELKKAEQPKKEERKGLSTEDYHALGRHLRAGKPYATFIPSGK